MLNLKNRVARLEGAQSKVNLMSMTDDELSAHINTLPFESAEGYAAIIALVMRHPSAFPVVHDDPAHKVGSEKWNDV
jgi:hypothetical protein